MDRKLALKYRGDEAERDEVQELGSTPIPPEAQDYTRHFNLLPNGVYENHRLLEGIARQYVLSSFYLVYPFNSSAKSLFYRVNTTLGNPEVVLIGQRSHGKTSILEALCGQMLGHVGFSIVRFLSFPF